MPHPPPASYAYAQQSLSRRSLLRIGGLGALGLNLPALYRAHAAGSTGGLGEVRSCILLMYYGGPCHIDTWDMKPFAPREIRGQFQSIDTSVPGRHVCEHMPHTARIVHKVAVVRSMHHPMTNHNAAMAEALCGRTPVGGDIDVLGANRSVDFPSYGAALSFCQGTTRLLPAYVALPHVMYNVNTLIGQNAGFLGPSFDPLQVTNDPNRPDFRINELMLPPDLPLARLDSRQALLGEIDAQLAQADAADKSLSVHQRKALDLLRSSEVRRAFDMASEPDAVRERYGRHTLGQSLLLARRLVESGVRFVNVNDKVSNGQVANWDSHENNFGRLKDDLLPPADQAFSALISDLDERGLLDSTLVIAMGEFGRTPTVNRSAGRDHWPHCFSMVLAGGGVRGGATHGTSDKVGAHPETDPVGPGDLAATIFWRFGVDPGREVHDTLGRPYRLAEGRPITSLFA